MAKNDGLLIAAAIAGAAYLATRNKDSAGTGSGIQLIPIGDGGGSMINLPEIKLPDMSIPSGAGDIETVITWLGENLTDQSGALSDLSEKVTGLAENISGGNAELPDIFKGLTETVEKFTDDAKASLDALFTEKMTDFMKGLQEAIDKSLETLKSFGGDVDNPFVDVVKETTTDIVVKPAVRWGLEKIIGWLSNPFVAAVSPGVGLTALWAKKSLNNEPFFSASTDTRTPAMSINLLPALLSNRHPAVKESGLSALNQSAVIAALSRLHPLDQMRYHTDNAPRSSPVKVAMNTTPANLTSEQQTLWNQYKGMIK
jgi:hypothetical protein